MGRTTQHRRSQAIPISPRSSAWSPSQRTRGRGDAPALPRRTPMNRGLLILIGLGLCAAAGFWVYGALDDGLPHIRPNVDVVDRPVSDDRAMVIFQVRPGQTALAIGEELQSRG